MLNDFTYLRDPGFTIHCHQIATSTLSPLYKLLPWPLYCIVFPRICLQSGGVSSERDANFGANRVACQNTLRAHFASVKWFAWEGNPVLLSVLWERDTVRTGPNMQCLPKVPVCVCICVCIYMCVTSASVLARVSWLTWSRQEAPVSFLEEHCQGLAYRWMRCVWCLNRQWVPMFSCFWYHFVWI